MTKDQLEQYPDLCAEIQELTEQLRRGVSDTVSASSTEYPYTQHPVTIQGAPPELHVRLEGLKKQKAEIEAFVAGLEDSKERRICRAVMKIGKRPSWPQVSKRLKYPLSSAESLRKTYERCFSKKV